MPSTPARVLLCNCEKTMSLDPAKMPGIDPSTPVHTQLCRAQLESFEKAVATGEPLLVACAQEAPLFGDVAEEKGGEAPVSFVNIRERAGWTSRGSDPSAKIAALLAEARVTPAPASLHTIESGGVCLVYGAGQAALDAALALEGRLSVTLLLTDATDVLLPPVLDVPVHTGRIRNVEGSLGDFTVTVDKYADMLPSSRGAPQFAMARDGARASCDLVLDMTGGTPLVSAPGHRDGYLRADPRDPAAVARALFELSDMVGTFEKPLYVHYDADICAHGRSGKTGCRACLDACPAGAITSAGSTIAIDPGLCGGCGSCSANCPTGAVSYQYPQRDAMIERIQVLLGTYESAGGKAPVLLVHGERHGDQVINALARFGEGLPENALPLAMHAPTALGHDALLAAVLAGARRIVCLSDPALVPELAPLEREIALAEALLAGMGYETEGLFEILPTSDPDALANALSPAKGKLPARSVRPAPLGGKREVARTMISGLLSGAPEHEPIIALPASAPYGRIAIDGEACTLCLACVSSCPASALSDNPDRPQVTLTEASCVQCGLCAATCPESAIALEARYDTTPAALRPHVLNEEDPATCVSCGKPFGTKSSIARIREKLSGHHWMFQSPEQVALIEMCDDCRISAQWNMENTPLRSGTRPRLVTTDDYLAAEANGLTADDFLNED
ncbi:MAG: 4Fe-4S ferredoxin [Stappia sp.]|nr:4Fe-4S ferredoxin [Stappia sp.]